MAMAVSFDAHPYKPKCSATRAYLLTLASHLVRFIIDGVITLPIALYGFLVFPDVPATTKAFYLSEEVCHIYLIPEKDADCVSNHWHKKGETVIDEQVGYGGYRTSFFVLGLGPSCAGEVEVLCLQCSGESD